VVPQLSQRQVRLALLFLAQPQPQRLEQHRVMGCWWARPASKVVVEVAVAAPPAPAAAAAAAGAGAVVVVEVGWAASLLMLLLLLQQLACLLFRPLQAPHPHP
jgi:hypothetical protein